MIRALPLDGKFLIISGFEEESGSAESNGWAETVFGGRIEKALIFRKEAHSASPSGWIIFARIIGLSEVEAFGTLIMKIF